MASPLTIFCLHYLGGSGGEFQPLARQLSKSVTVITVDLPGFGVNRELRDYSVCAMAQTVVARIRANRSQNWLLVGHSMGAKVASVIARQSEDGAEGLAGLRGLILLAGSPPGPEPMEDSKREEMLGWFKEGPATSRAQAQEYIRQNTGTALPASLAELAVQDAMRAHPDAWQAWLMTGSREDWSDRVGRLDTPTLLVAGARDAGLGEAAQRRHAMPHYSHVSLRLLEAAGHLLPLEQPVAVAQLIQTPGAVFERLFYGAD